MVVCSHSHRRKEQEYKVIMEKELTRRGSTNVMLEGAMLLFFSTFFRTNYPSKGKKER